MKKNPRDRRTARNQNRLRIVAALGAANPDPLDDRASSSPSTED